MKTKTIDSKVKNDIPKAMIDWKAVDWSKSDAEIAKSLNVTETVVRAKRKIYDHRIA